jgi:hypothetical protein
LLDEIDRLRPDELMTLLKVVRLLVVDRYVV